MLTRRSASNSIVQLVRPSGGSLQASATSIASSRPESLRGAPERYAHAPARHPQGASAHVRPSAGWNAAADPTHVEPAPKELTRAVLRPGMAETPILAPSVRKASCRFRSGVSAVITLRAAAHGRTRLRSSTAYGSSQRRDDPPRDAQLGAGPRKLNDIVPFFLPVDDH